LNRDRRPDAGPSAGVELAWNPEDGWILVMQPEGGGLAWHAVDAPADEPVVRLAARLVDFAPLAGATCTVRVASCFRPIGTIEVRAGRVVAAEDHRR
jgi:hypothetical protein